MATAFDFCDDLGPEKIIHLHDPTGSGLRAIVVVDNVAAGPAIGGTRMAADVSLQECFRLARAMTLKNAAAGLPHGGAKSVIFADPGLPADQKQQLVRAFAYAIRDVLDYIPGPDMGTDETCMAWVRDTIGRAVGLPRAIGGIPLDEIGATGYGLATALDVAQEPCGFTLRGARVVVQGFGSVGKHAARFLAERGAVLVGASDTSGTLHNPGGIDVAALIAFKDAGNGVADFPGGTRQPGDAVIDIPCEISDSGGPARRHPRGQRAPPADPGDRAGRQHPLHAGGGGHAAPAGGVGAARLYRQCRRRHMRLGGVPRRLRGAGAAGDRREDRLQYPRRAGERPAQRLPAP